MQVGVITIDGREVGAVTFSEGAPDTTQPMLAEAMPTEGAYGGPEHYSLPEHGSSRGAPRQPHDRPAAEPSHPSHRHGPGHYPRGETRERAQEHKREQRDLGGIPYSSSGNPFDRGRFAKELQDKPWLKEKVAHIALGENQDPKANLAVIETMMNRAVVRGTSLEAQAKRHRQSGVDEGGYYAGWAPHYSSDKKAMFDRNLGNALGGSNITNYATDNSSGNLAKREIQSGAFKHHKTINGESFFSPGHAEPGHRDRWQSLNQKATEFEKGQTTKTGGASGRDHQSSLAKPQKLASLEPHDWMDTETGNPILDIPSSSIDVGNPPTPGREPAPDTRPPNQDKFHQNEPPTPGDEDDPARTKRPSPFSIPQDYDIG